jgi:hypothetical protein
MYLAELAEVAIGLVVVYFLVSMASSQILEWFSQFFVWRSRDLEAAIRAMILNEPMDVPVIRPIRWLWRNITGRFKGAAADSGKEAEKLIEQLYKHPLIKSLASKYPILGTEIKPAYIPTRAFALALFDAVMTAGTEASRIQGTLATVRNTVSQLPGPDPKVIEQLDNLIKQAAVVIDLNEQALLDKLKQELDGFKAAYPKFQPQIDALLSVDPKKADTALTQFRHSLLGLEARNLDLKRTLESLVSQAALSIEQGEATLATARTNVEAWFDANMDQLTDLYKRRSKLWSGVIALVLAVILNVDTLVIANTLWREPTLRQTIVANAEKLPPPPTPAPSTATTAITATQSISPTITVNELKKQLEELQLPIGGWQAQPLALKPGQMCVIVPGTAHVWGIWWNGACKVLVLQDLKPGLSGALAKLAGWLITALAAAQGAPFWFDLLNKLLQLRGGEKKPEEKAATA